MVQETIFQHWIFTQFAFPFLLIWTLVFALLGKTKLLGDNKQIDSIVAFVIAFVFIGAAYPKDIVHNLVLFLFKQSWSNTLWTNVTFVVVIAVALAVMMKAKK